MLLNQETLRFIFGVKLRTLRLEKNLSLKELATVSGLSPSYINEIEKGKKYPKSEKIMLLAKGLQVSYDDLISLQLSKELNTLSDILQKSSLQNLPLEIFGIPSRILLELLMEKPTEFSAIIGACLEMARNYDIKIEEFFFASLRAYLDMHNNYFPKIEDKVDEFCNTNKMKNLDDSFAKFFTVEGLSNYLQSNLKYEIIENDFGYYPKELQHLMFFYVPENGHRLYLNKNISIQEKIFILSREIGYGTLKLKERNKTSDQSMVDSFGKVYNNFHAAYFASSLIIPKKPFIEATKSFFSQSEWNPKRFIEWAHSYPCTIESFFHRLTQVLPTFFHVDQIYLIRFHYNKNKDEYSFVKELHLSKLHVPYIVKKQEDYCRRWLTSTIVKQVNDTQKIKAGAQISSYWGTDEKYLNLSIAFPTELTEDTNACLTLGILMNDSTKKTVSFVNDSSIPKKTVASTCQRCGVENCEERVGAAFKVEEKLNEDSIKEAIKKVSST